MEKLTAYCDSSNSSDENEISGLKFKTSSSDYTEIAQSPSGDKINFFNFCGSSLLEKEQTHDDPSSTFNIGSELDESLEHGIGTPSGNFWRGFVPESKSNGILEKCSIASTTDTNISVRQSETKVCESGTNSKRKHCYHHLENPTNPFCEETNNKLQVNKQSYKRKRSKHDSFHDQKTPNNSIHPTDNQNQDGKKIFYVHDKIEPYLDKTPPCSICASNSHSSWTAHNRAANSIEWNKAKFSHLLLTAGMDSSVKVWNVWSCLERCVSKLTHHSKGVRRALWGTHGTNVVSCSYDKTAVVTDVETGKMQSRHVHPHIVSACAISSHNPYCFVTGCENLIQFWDSRTPMVPTSALTYKAEIGQPNDLLFAPSGKELISCSDIVARDSADRNIMVWDIQSGNVISNQIYQERYTCVRLKRHPSYSKFLAQSQGGYVALFSTSRPYKINKNKRFEGHKVQGYNIGFDISPDGSLVYSGSAEEGIHCYNFHSGRLVKKLTTNHHAVVTDVACHPVLTSLVASCTWDGNILLWQ